MNLSLAMTAVMQRGQIFYCRRFDSQRIYLYKSKNIKYKLLIRASMTKIKGTVRPSSWMNICFTKDIFVKYHSLESLFRGRSVYLEEEAN